MILYPWPHASLNPNSRNHWAVKARHAKQSKSDAWSLTKQANIKINGAVTLKVTFRPPSNARHDLDNCLARCKHLIDGISQAIGIDDSKFNYELAMGEKMKCGGVEVEIKQQ